MPPAARSLPGPPSSRPPSSSWARGSRAPPPGAPDPGRARTRGPAAPLQGLRAARRCRPPSPRRSLPPPAPHYCASSISKVRRLLSLAALPTHSAPRRFLLLRLPLAVVALLTSSSSSSSPPGLPVPLPWLPGHSPPSPYWRWSVPRAGSCCLRIREKRRERLPAEKARPGERREGS